MELKEWSKTPTPIPTPITAMEERDAASALTMQHSKDPISKTGNWEPGTGNSGCRVFLARETGVMLIYDIRVGRYVAMRLPIYLV